MAAAEPSTAHPRRPGSDHHREVYTHGYGGRAQEWMSQRRAAEAADFILPHLRPGMRVLDCGCGPGSITVDLATAVAPGEVIGIDIEQSQLDTARALAAERGGKTCNSKWSAQREAGWDMQRAGPRLQHLAHAACQPGAWRVR